MSIPTAALRRDLEAAFAAAVAAVQPARLLSGALDGLPAVGGRMVVAAIGKAGPTLASAWLDLQLGRVAEVIVLAPHGVPVAEPLACSAEVLRGAHPYPDEEGERSARRLLAVAGELASDDLLVVLLSGGGSALLAAPAPGLTLEDVRSVTRALLTAGAPITAVNTVRRQLLSAAGGGLARAAFPARVVAFIVSDVIGDPLADIASGPTVASPTGAAEAVVVLDRFVGRHRVPAAVERVLTEGLDRPPDCDEWRGRTTTRILANNGTAKAAAAAELAARGYRVIAPAPALTGEASARGAQLGGLAAAARVAAPTAVVLGGETTVTVRGSGRGGRNQELALAAALGIAGGPPRALLAAGTDGIDGMSDHAGALVDQGTVARLKSAGLDARACLAANDSARATAAAGDALVTGPTGTNVCDVTLLALV